MADKEEGLISNNMVYLLASPTELKELSWIKPGVVMFDWWGKNNIYGVNFKAGVNTETAKYFIDFCAEKGFRYFLLMMDGVLKMMCSIPFPVLIWESYRLRKKEGCRRTAVGDLEYIERSMVGGF